MPFSQELETRLEHYELASVREYVQPRTRDVLTFVHGAELTVPAAKSAGADSAGVESAEVPSAPKSKVGGVPDLPPDLEWPTVDAPPKADGTPGVVAAPMVFVAQLNLADVAPLDPLHPLGLLPDHGMLYFFFGNDEPSLHMPHAVRYVEHSENLTPAMPVAPPLYTRSKPHLFGVDAQNPLPFHCFELVPRPGLNIPPLPYAEEALDAIADTIEDDEQAENLPEVYDMFARELDGNWICKLWGYPEEHNGDLEYEAALHIHTGQDYDCFKDSALATLADHFGNNPARAEKAVADTLLLLEVRSDCRTGFMWGNNGVIHFFIDKEDLAAKDFSRTFCSLTYT